MCYYAQVCRMAVLTSLLLAVVILTGRSALAQLPGREKIVFSGGSQGVRNIYSINLDGTGPTRLTNDPKSIFPACSSTGKIAFTSSRTGNSDIYVMNWDGTNQFRVTTNTYDEIDAAWSPDGKHIAFSSTLSGDHLHRIHVVNADGSNVVKVSNGLDGDRVPCFQTPSTISFDKPAFQVGEAVGTATFTLRRTGASNGQVTARVTLTDATTSPADYRYQPGALDPTYPQLPAGSPYYSSQMSFQSDGKLLVGNPVSRFNPDGTPDATFHPAALNGGPRP